MRNFFIFIWRNQFTFLFLLLELLGFLLLVSNNPHQQSAFHSFTVSVAGSVYDIRDNFTAYLKLDEDNMQLRQENARLREMLKNSEYSFPVGPTIKEDTLYHQQYDYVAGKVVNNTVYLGNNYLIINLGRQHGIEPQMGVMGPQGAVGIVQGVSDNYAAVMSLVHTRSVVSCRLEKNNYFGLCRWKGGDPQTLLLEDIPNHVNIGIGDKVITRGSSGIFPEGILVGTIKAFNPEQSSGFHYIEVDVATNFRNLTSVYVIRNFQKEEQNALETTLQDEQ